MALSTKDTTPGTHRRAQSAAKAQKAKPSKTAKPSKKTSSVLYPPEPPETQAEALRTLLEPEAAAKAALPTAAPDVSGDQIAQAVTNTEEPVSAVDSGTAPDARYEDHVHTLAFSVIDRHQHNVRRTMDPQELTALTASLQQYGMMHPVIVEPIPGKQHGYRYRLVAGFRRVAAAQSLGWTAVPARILKTPLGEQDRAVFQLTENLQREAMRLRDIVQSIQELQAVGFPQRDIAERLGLAEATVRLYRQLGDILTAHPRLWPHFDKGLISIDHFRAAYRLLTRIRQRAGDLTTDPTVQAQIMEQAESLFVAMLDRLARVQPLTTKRVVKEVAQLLERAGLTEDQGLSGKAAPDAETSAARGAGMAPAVLLGSYEKLTLTDWPKEALEKFVTVSEAKLQLAKERLAEIG